MDLCQPILPGSCSVGMVRVIESSRFIADVADPFWGEEIKRR